MAVTQKIETSDIIVMMLLQKGKKMVFIRRKKWNNDVIVAKSHFLTGNRLGHAQSGKKLNKEKTQKQRTIKKNDEGENISVVLVGRKIFRFL